MTRRSTNAYGLTPAERMLRSHRPHGLPFRVFLTTIAFIVLMGAVSMLGVGLTALSNGKAPITVFLVGAVCAIALAYLFDKALIGAWHSYYQDKEKRDAA
jgi:uncharacterized membrane protein